MTDYPKNEDNIHPRQFERCKVICPKCGWKATTTRKICKRCSNAILIKREGSAGAEQCKGAGGLGQ